MKTKSIYVCSNCGYKSAKWIGKCNNCGTWDSFQIEETVTNKKGFSLKRLDATYTKLKEVEFNSSSRLSSGFIELNRVLGGGIMEGSLILLAGDPGIGKSTLTLQMVNNLKLSNPLYITAEESLEQIKHRALRVDNYNDELEVMAETNLEAMLEVIKNGHHKVIIVDSIQSISSDSIDASPGSYNQVRECTNALMSVAKKIRKTIFIIGHVTKEGVIAGPKMLEHMVDTVLQFEGEKNYAFRIIRALKNRYGSTNEIGIFEMGEKGLREVLNPSEIFLTNRSDEESGVANVAAIEGTRPIILEIQSLVSATSFAVPQRTANGFDNRRLQMILAVLEKRLGAKFYKNDVFLNVAGGVYLNDTSVDLSVAASLISSLNDQPINKHTVFIGEIGLTGEVRSVSHFEQRINEAVKLGFKKVIVPKNNADKLLKKSKIEIIPVEKISIALQHAFV
jgi:DNA repair protein RadA/Sms